MKPLDDITVVEVDSWMAAPSAGAVLADLGARVVKVEPLSGDPMRGTSRPGKVDGDLQGYDFGFDVDNRGKRSLAVDLGRAEGSDVVRRLCAQADVFLCNLLPRRQERFGLDATTLHGVNSRLVHATLTGYGTSGPQAWRPGYDVTAFFGRSGLYDSMRETHDGIVSQARPAQGDHTTGLALVATILSALRLAERTGEGQVVETSLYEVAAWTLATDLAPTATDLAPVSHRSRHRMITPTANRYPCGDDKWVVFNMPERDAFDRLAAVIGLEHLLEEERFSTFKARFDNMAELVDLIDEALASRTRDEWGELFDEHGLIWGPVLCLHEVVVDDQAQALGMFPTIDHPTKGSYRTVRTPLRIHGVDTDPTEPSPVIGEHSREVLMSAGFDRREIDALVASGAVASGSPGDDPDLKAPAS